jgi:hypothetical protein
MEDGALPPQQQYQQQPQQYGSPRCASECEYYSLKKRMKFEQQRELWIIKKGV